MNQHGFPVAYRRGAGGMPQGSPSPWQSCRGWWTRVAVYRGLPSALREVLLEKLTAPGPPAPAEAALPPGGLEPPRGRPRQSPPRVGPDLCGAQRQHALRFVPVTYNNQGTRCLGEACLVTPKGMLWSQERHQPLGGTTKPGN